MISLLNKLPAISGTVFARLAVVAIGLLTSVITARSLGPEGRGQYFTVMTVAAIVAQFGNLGLSSSNTFLAAQYPAAAKRLVLNGVWVCAVLGSGCALVVAAFGSEIASFVGLSVELLWPACILAPAILAFTLASSVLVAMEKFVALNMWQLANAVLAAVVLGACAASEGAPIQFVFATTAVALSVSSAITIQLVSGDGVKLAFDRALFRQGVEFSSRAYFALLLGFLLQRAAVTLLAANHGQTEVGYFSIAAQINDVLIILPTTVSMVLFPMLVKQDRGRWQTTWQALRYGTAMMAVVCAIAAIVGYPLIAWVFGRPFSQSYFVLLWLLPGVMMLSMTTILSQFIVAKRFPRSLIMIWAVGLTVCICVGWPLTALFGANGAAAAQSAGTVVVFVGCALLARRVANEEFVIESRT